VIGGPYPALHHLSLDLGEALKRFGFNRAFVGGVALTISILTKPNEPFFVTLGPNTNWSDVYPCIQERYTLQSLLAVGLSRHGLAPTPWHSSRTGPDIIPPGLSDTYPDTLPRLTEYPDPVPPRVASLSQTILPIFQNPPLVRTEAQHRGLDILQNLHALLDLCNPTENVPDHLSLSNDAFWDFQQYHRSIIHDLRELLPILVLTYQQRPYRAELGRVGRALLVELLFLRRSRADTRPDPTHVQHSLGLRANTGEIRIRMELNQAIYILSVEEDVPTLDLLLGWLEDALPEFHWMWPTVGKAKTIHLLMNRLDSTCHPTHKLSDMNRGLRAVEVLCLLCQDLSFCKDILEIGTHRLLHTVDKARRMQMYRNEHDPVRSRALDIQLTIIECVNRTTATRPLADPQPGVTREPLRGWSVETTWQWILQTMLALKSISVQPRPHRTRSNYAAGLRALHHFLTFESHLTTQQRENAWLLLGREECPSYTLISFALNSKN